MSGLTASCIWRSFRNSGKRHLILTGDRGCGKTTLLSHLFPTPRPGITTWAQPELGVYLRENTSGLCVQVGRFDPSRTGRENKMAPIAEGFTSLGVQALSRCAGADDGWVTIDEVGYLENACPEYQSALRRLMERQQVAAVVRKQDLPFLRELRERQDAFVVDLDAPFGAIGCVVMASGLGRRFGGNKLMADFRGEPLLCRVLAATQDIFPRRVVVTRHREVADLCRARGIQVLLHDLPHRSDTIRLGLEEMDGMDRCMFCAADQPLLRRETVQALALSCVNSPEHIWRTAYRGEPGNPVVFPAWAFAQLCALPEGMGGGVLIKKYPQHLRLADVGDGDELRDADTPEELSALLER